MTFDEHKLRGFLSQAADEAPDAIADSSRILRRARRYQLFLGATAFAAVSILVGGGVLAAGSLRGDDGPNPLVPAQASESPASPSQSLEPSPSEEPSPQPSQSVPESALLTGNGRIPLGDVSLCPNGDLLESQSTTEDEVISASRAVLESANAPEPDSARLWTLLDPALQAAYGSEEQFAETISSASLDKAFREWEVSDSVTLDAGPVLGQFISDTCGQAVAESIVMGQAYFPEFDGLSGGSAQLYFTVRESGLRFWLLD